MSKQVQESFNNLINNIKADVIVGIRLHEHLETVSKYIIVNNYQIDLLAVESDFVTEIKAMAYEIYR